MSQISKIAFIGFLTGAIPLVGLPSNPGRRVLEIGIITGVASAVCAFHYLIYSMIIQGDSPGRAETLSLVIAAVFFISYFAFRCGGALWKAKGSWHGKPLVARVLRKAKGSWHGKPFKAATVTTILAWLILVAVTYPYPADSERPTEVDFILRSETTGEVWVIEAERADDDWPVEVGRDTVYLASATIVGLATFGSLLSVRVLGSPKTLKPRKRGFFIISIGVGMTIGFQSILMHKACCGSISAVLFDCLFLATVVALVLIACGFSLIRDSWFKDGTDSSSPRQ